jgi:predicted alpha-1,6-mannanase (GH76 family)
MPEQGDRGRAAAGIEALQRWYRPWSGQWRTTGWWNAANALTAVIAYTRRTGDDTHASVVGRTFAAAGRRHRHFLNRFYDDSAWWALAWVDAFDLTGDRRYLDAAEVIFADLTTAWDDHCGGGLWWNHDRRYKNAITNELFLTLAARLHQRAGGTGAGPGYLDWALREWQWFSASGMIGPSGLVSDGLTADCANNGGVTWTYNQGVILGGLAALHEITGDRGYRERGESIAGAALTQLTSPASAAVPGILTEPLEAGTPPGDQDRPQFKGIFVRYLYDFARVSPRPEYGAFILANARSLWDNARSTSNEFGLRWSGPFDRADAGRQGAALDVLNAAAGLAAG